MADNKRTYFYQGVRDFPDFESYLKEWLIPSTLGDLRTIFEGATEHWEVDRRRARGNFMLATVLMAAMDHLGAFLRKRNDEDTNWKHISLVAGLLPSTRDVPTIMAYCGRNSLVHGAWPTTMLVVKDGPDAMRFGLNISAEADISQEHRKLYWKKYTEPLGKSGDEQDVLKLRLNIYALFDDLSELLKHWQIVVYPEIFEYVKKQSGILCHFQIQGDQIKRGSELGDKVPSKRPRTESGSKETSEWRRTLVSEIRYLFERAPEHGEEKILPPYLPNSR